MAYIDPIGTYPYEQYRTSFLTYFIAIPFGEGVAEEIPTTGQIWPRGR